MKLKNNPATDKSDSRLVVTRLINAPCAMVFKAWTEPKQMVQWWSPKDIECRSVTADTKVGGAYRIHMVAEDGDHIAYGKYAQFVPNERLQFSWEWENKDMPVTTVTVDFRAEGKTTRVTLTHEGFVEKAEAESHTSGWTTAIEKFAEMMESNQIKA